MIVLPGPVDAGHRPWQHLVMGLGSDVDGAWSAGFECNRFLMLVILRLLHVGGRRAGRRRCDHGKLHAFARAR